jgi:tape measure domain-containing protein
VGANDTRRLRVVVTGESSDAQQSLAQVGDSAEKSQSKIVTLAKTIGGMALKGTVALGAVGAAAATMGFSTATQLEQVSVGFTTMLGSAQKAQKFLKQLQAFANTTPFEFEDVTGAAQKFLSMGFAAKDVIPMLTAVGDAVAAMGGSAENIDSITTALTQMQIKGKVSGEEIMQLSEQGVPALQILADRFHVSVSEMSKMISKGDVLSKKAIPLIIDGLEHGTKSVKGFGGMMNAQSQTMSGKWSTFMDTLKSGLGNLATIFLPGAKRAVDLVSTAMQNFFSGLQGFGKAKGFTGLLNQIGLGLRAMVLAFKDGDVTSKGLIGTFEKIGATAKIMIDSFKTGESQSDTFATKAQAVALALRAVYDALIAVIDATKQAITWLKEHDTVAKALVITMGSLYAITKAYAITTAVQAAGGLMAMFKNLTLVMSVMKTVTAVQWAFNGAVAAGKYLQVAGYLAGMAVAQKAWAAAVKVATAVQWLWNTALDANPIGLIIVAIGALVAAVVLLWQHNEGFRKFVMNTLWPGLKAVWNALKVAFQAVVGAMVTAWNWLRDTAISVWKAIAGFITPIVQTIIAIFSPLFNVFARIGSVLWTLYSNGFKVVWILIQIAVKLVVFWFRDVVWPVLKWVFDQIAMVVQFLYNYVFKPYFDRIRKTVQGVVEWFQNTALPYIKAVWAAIQIITKALVDRFVAQWNAIKNKVMSVVNYFFGPVVALFKAGMDKLKKFLDQLRVGWSIIWDAVRDKFSKVWNGISTGFKIAVDAIQKQWQRVKDVAKAPINFVINDIYNNRIAKLWNTVAEKFGIKTRLDSIKGFATGGTVGKGYGNKDDQLAMLTRGEGILTTSEMRKLGGPAGFAKFRQNLAMYNKGGVVGGDGIGGWFSSLASKGKDIIQGIAGSAIKPLVNTIRTLINSGLPATGFGGLMRGGANTILNNLVSWVSGKDKQAGAIGGGGGQGMGWQNQIKLLRSAFPGLSLISGFRPGAHTLSGNLSYHAMGRAVDVPPMRAVAMWIRQHFGSSTKELITPWPELDLRNGRFHDYDHAIDAQHGVYGNNAHVHWAMDSASVVQPGWFTGYNGTGKPETLVNADKLGGGFAWYGDIIIQGSPDPRQTAKVVRDELIKLGNRNGGSIGLPKR